MSSVAKHSGPAGFVRGLGNGTFAVLVIALLAVVLAIGIVPKLLGGAALTVLTGSMEPTYQPGDIVVSVPEDHYRIGEAITFQPRSADPTLITHRVVAVRSTPDGIGYVTRGDANGDDDDPIVAAQVMGKVIYSVPKLGFAQQLLGSNKGIVVALLGLGLLAFAGYTLVSSAVAARNTRRRGISHGD